MARLNRIRFARGTEAQIAASPLLHGEPAISTDTDNLFIGTATSRIRLARDTELSGHAGTTTGVHGVGASTVESVAGAQAKVNTHAGAADPHPANLLASGVRPLAGHWSLGGFDLTSAGAIDRVRTRPGVLRANLGDPTVEEMALIDAQFTNKFAFFPPTLQEESTNGITWTTSTRLTSAQLAELTIGRGNLGGGAIMTFPTAGAANWYRLTWDLPVGRHQLLSALYMYMNTQANDIHVRIEAFHHTTGWTEVAPHGTVSGWANHVWFKHRGLDSHAAGYRIFRITFWTTASQNTNPVFLQSLEWWGGFPVASRDVERYDSARNAHFPAGMTMQGRVGVGTPTPHASSALDLTATDRGFLPPRMTEAQRNAIASPAAGLMVYNTTSARINFWDGAAWRAVNSA